jgi:catalase
MMQLGMFEDSTKLIPVELVPLAPLGKMVLDRNVDKQT